MSQVKERENKKNQVYREKGEPFVWFAAMGLTVGLLMVCFLFGLIAFNGTVVFWPSTIVEVELEDQQSSSIKGQATIAGVAEGVRTRTERVLDDSIVPQTYLEERFFVGNRDVYGQSFTHFRTSKVVSRKTPKEIMLIERGEWGDALVYPEKLQLGSGQTIQAKTQDFLGTLGRLVVEVKDRREQIANIDRHQIGRINFKMRDIELSLRYFEQKGNLSHNEQETVLDLKNHRKELEQQYQILETEANQLRELQSLNRLYYRLPSGEQGSISLGDVYRFTLPNQLSFFQKVGVFLSEFKDFIFGYPREANTEGGIYPAIFGTFVMTLIMSIAVMPFGVIAAVYLREYAKQGPLVRAVRISVNNLAGVPSIVFGVFGLGFFVYLLGGTIDQIFYSKALPSPTFGAGGILWAGLTLALLNVPVVIVATEEALSAVSRGVREGALACGASKWQTIQSLVLPASLPGILTGLVLAMARGAGEVAPLMLVGVVALAPNLPIDGNFPFIHLERSFMHLGFHIYDVGFQSPDSEAAIPMVFATTLVLIALIIVLNLSAILLRNHIRKKNQASAF